MTAYFNHRTFAAHGWWERWSFVRRWWNLQAGDPYWAPPPYLPFRRQWVTLRDPHLARLAPQLIYSEALPRRDRFQPGASPPAFEQTVTAAAILTDPRRTDRTAYVSLLHCANDPDSLRHWLDAVAERLLMQGYRRLIGPIGLSPHLGSGLLQDCWNVTPPLHTPYSPPYLPEVMADSIRARSSGRLFYFAPPANDALPANEPANLRPLTPHHLAGRLLPLLAAACPPWLDFVPPDISEAQFLLRWLAQWPLWGWLATLNDDPAGFALLQPDFGPALRQSGGGRTPWGWLWLQLKKRRPTRAGRLLFLGVLPPYRGRGIGRQLLTQALADAAQRGWESLTAGPLPTTAPGARFAEHLGAAARQTYLLYQRDL